MKLYVSGAITGHEEESYLWRKEWAKKLKKVGFNIYDPLIVQYKRFGKLVFEDMSSRSRTIVHEDLRRLIGCDAVLVNAKRPSWGAGAEVSHACDFKKSVWVVCKPPVPIWLKYYADEVFPTLDEFIKWAGDNGLIQK